MTSILCVENESAVARQLERRLQQLGHDVELTSSLQSALERLARRDVDLVLSELRLPDGSGLELLDALADRGNGTPVVILTSQGSVRDAVSSMRCGAVDYLIKPMSGEALRLAVHNAIEIGKLRRENADFRQRISRLQAPRTIVGRSTALKRSLEMIESVAPTRATVLLEGESGTGKELFARAIHERSPRRDRPFVILNCAAVPEGLVESALFGHERGAFTGAVARSEGAFERAHQGTLLLDEITEMRVELQAKLLRALQEREFERVGGSRPVRVDVRLIATTNRDLREEVAAGRFRRDLFYRLSVVPIHAPPLRQRLEDLPLLVAHFAGRAAAELGIRPPLVPPETMDRLTRHPWPGNVRELANAVERAIILCRGGTLPASAFDLRADAGEEAPPGGAPAAAPPAILNIAELKHAALCRALLLSGGNRRAAAGLLGMSDRGLRAMIQRARRRGESVPVRASGDHDDRPAPAVAPNPGAGLAPPTPRVSARPARRDRARRRVASSRPAAALVAVRSRSA